MKKNDHSPGNDLADLLGDQDETEIKNDIMGMIAKESMAKKRVVIPKATPDTKNRHTGCYKSIKVRDKSIPFIRLDKTAQQKV